MGVMQMMLTGMQYPVSLADYITTDGNWAKFYKGQMVTAGTNTNTAGNVTYGLDNQTTNSFMTIASTYSLTDIPVNYPSSTIFYLEYKVNSKGSPNQGGFSSAAPFSPKYGVRTIYSINANANPYTAYAESAPAVPETFYLSPTFGNYVSMYGNYGMQARSVAVANVPIKAQDIIGTTFYQNGVNTESDSPSTLVMPGYWRRVGDSGSTTFTSEVVDTGAGESGDYPIYGTVMNTTTPATFAVEPGDLVIATTMLAKHPIDSVPSGDVRRVFSWTRNRLVSGRQNAHGMSIWISKETKTYSISRAIDQYPGSRFLVFRYDPTGIANPLPPVTPITTPIVGGGSGRTTTMLE